jgi:hypothetical protein
LQVQTGFPEPSQGAACKCKKNQEETEKGSNACNSKKTFRGQSFYCLKIIFDDFGTFWPMKKSAFLDISFSPVKNNLLS